MHSSISLKLDTRAFLAACDAHRLAQHFCKCVYCDAIADGTNDRFNASVDRSREMVRCLQICNLVCCCLLL